MTEVRASELPPGSYIWNPSLATGGPLSMRVRLASQTAYVYRGDTLIGITTIASGKPGYETPDGMFTVLEKERFHNSNRYDNAPMPYMQRLTWYGLALHGGHPHGYPASHGCIRLPMGFAAALFKEDTTGMSVAITGHAPTKEQMIARRQKTRTPATLDGVQATELANGQGESDTTPEACCAPSVGREQAIPSTVPDRAGDDEADDQPDSGPESGDTYYYPDRTPDDDQRYSGYHPRARQPERTRELPPEDLPPPPD